MDKSKINKLIDNLMAVKMTEHEKDTMQRHLLAFTRSYEEPVSSPYLSFIFSMHKAFSVALIAILFVGSLSKPASAGALPGEFLYPVKIIHEEIEAVTKQTPEKKVQHEIKRAERRVEEATKLSSKQKLDDEKQVVIAQNIQKHTNNAQEKIQELKKEDPEKALELNSQLKDSLKENAQKIKVAVDVQEEQEEEEVVLATVLVADEQEEEIESDANEEVSGDMEIMEASTLRVAVIEEVKEEENILLSTLEDDIEETERVSQEVQMDIDAKTIQEENKEVQEPVISDNDLQNQQHIKVLERIVEIEADIEVFEEDTELVLDEATLLEIKAKKETLTALISEKKYSSALLVLEELLLLYQEKEESQEDIEEEVELEAEIVAPVEIETIQAEKKSETKQEVVKTQ